MPASSGGQPSLLNLGSGSPDGRVLGIEDVNTAEGACWADEPDARVVVKTWDGQKLCGECALKEGYIMRLETGMMLRVDLRSTIFHRNEHGKVPA